MPKLTTHAMILKINETISDYRIDELLSNDGCPYREVYSAFSQRLVWQVFFVVYRLDALPPAINAEHIGEFEVCRRLRGEGFFRCVEQKRMTYEGVEIAWMALLQPHSNYFKLSELPDLFDSAAMCYKMMDDVLRAVKELVSLTGGGGHYNITPDNVLLTLESEDADEQGKGIGDEVVHAYLVNLEFAGKPCSGRPPFDVSRLDALYRARETYLGRFSAASDIFSLGLLWGFIVTQGYPYELTEGAKGRNLAANLKHLKPASSEEREAWLAVTRRAASLRVQDRYFNIDEMRLDLARVMGLPLPTDVEVPADRDPKSVPPPTRNAEEFARLEEEMRGNAASNNGQPTLNLTFSVLHGDGFASVAGMEELKHKLTRDFVQLLSHPDLAQLYDVRPPNLLLFGPPGTGKTYLSERLAEECGMECSVVRPSDLGSTFVHGTQALIKDLFEKAAAEAKRNNRGVLLVFDEFDAFCPQRTADNYNNQAGEVGEFLSQLNNCFERNIYVVGTTNCPERIDKAVMRKGRIDELIYVGMPDGALRAQLFGFELKKRPCAPDIDLTRLSNLTDGFTPADIAYMVKETARQQLEATLRDEQQTVQPITGALLESTISKTFPSVPPSEVRRYERLRDELLSHGKDNRQRIGFKQ